MSRKRFYDLHHLRAVTFMLHFYIPYVGVALVCTMIVRDTHSSYS